MGACNVRRIGLPLLRKTWANDKFIIFLLEIAYVNWCRVLMQLHSFSTSATEARAIILFFHFYFLVHNVYNNNLDLMLII